MLNRPRLVLTALSALFLLQQQSQMVVAQPLAAVSAPASNVTKSGLDMNNLHGHNMVINFGNSSTKTSFGNITNGGTIFLVSSNPAIKNGTLNISNLLNLSGASITSVLPSAGLLGFKYLVPNFSFTLNASGDITNHGNLSSAGGLVLSAGGQVINTGTISSSNSLSITATNTINNSGLIQSGDSLGLTSGTGLFTNSGVLTSISGNVVVNTVTPVDLVLNNTAGTINALEGAISFRDASFAGNNNLSVFGGNIFSPSLYLNSGTGSVSLDLDKVNSQVNVTAAESSVYAHSGNLNLGKFCVSGDPTIYNSGGDIIINTNLVFPGSPLALVASGNIVSESGAANISTASTSKSGDGGDIVMIAGASFTSSLGPTSKDPFAPVILSISGATIAGGNIDLNNSAKITALNSSSKTGDGGNITLIAFGGSAPASGNIILPSSVTINSSGAGSNSSGGAVSVFSSLRLVAISHLV